MAARVLLANRSKDDEANPQESHAGLQGEGGVGCHEGRQDAGRTGSAFRCAPEPDYAMAKAGAGRGGWPIRRGQGRDEGGAERRLEGASRQDRRADPGERFFRRGAHQGGIAERKAMIDREHDLPISWQAEALGVSRGAVYYKPRPTSAEDLLIMRRLDELHLDYPFAGSRMLRDFLNREGVSIGRRHVASLMKRIGIAAIYRRPNTSKPAPGHKIYPYLLRGLKIERADQVWAMDITYIPMARGFVYLAAVVDVFSRRVLAHRVSITMEADFCIEALEEALARHGRPEIFNTDQGSQFTSVDFTGVLLKHGARSAWTAE